MKQNFPASLAATLRYEGGYSNHPSDPGGPTMKGVTQRVYDAWRKKHGLAPRGVRQLAQDELEAIYRRDYWDRCKCDDLPGGVDLAVFDFAVNSGPVRAIKYLQNVVGVGQDGIVGPRTIAAAEAMPDCAVKLCDARLAFMKRLGTWSVFGKGWGDRMADVRKKCAAMAKVKAPPTAKAAPYVEEKTVFDEIGDFIDWTRHPEEAARQVPTPSAHRDDALHVYLVPAIIAFIGALASADWNTAFDNPQASILVILTGAVAAAYQAAAPWYLKMIWKGPVSA
jgi:lysozyme family protein